MEISEAVLTAFDKEVASTCDQEGWPSAVAGIVAAGTVLHAATAGAVEGAGTVYRIASMTKSFTAAAVLALRDDGRLRLDDTVGDHVPELVGLRGPGADSPPITLRHLLTMSGGMATDDRWGDRQLAVGAGELNDWFRLGATFAHPTGVAMEYSNYGYAMLGRVIENVVGSPYDQVVTERFLRPLGMTSTAFRREDLPAGATTAVPHHRIADELVVDDSGLLGHGGFGAMGGLWSTVADLARWVGFLGDAFPSRDDEAPSPLSRASRREMQQVHRAYEPPGISFDANGSVRMIELGYGMGVEVLSHAAIGKIVTHSGGLPGYGSNMRWAVDRGIGVVTLANVTYAKARSLADRLLELLVSHQAVPQAPRRSAPLVDDAARRLVDLLNDWSADKAATLFADNVDLDESLDRRATAAARLIDTYGTLAVSTTVPLSATEGDATLIGADGAQLTLELQLTPTVPPLVQWYEVVPPASPTEPEALGSADAAATALRTPTPAVDTADEPVAANLGGDPAALVLRHLEHLGAAHEVMPCDPDLADTAAFCAAYGISPDESANTIIVVGKSDPPTYVACVVLATTRLDVNGTVRRRLGVKKASFASGEETRALTGMIIGGVTAFGLPAAMPIWVDSRVMSCDRIVVGGGSRACKILGAPTMLTANPMVEVIPDLAKIVES